MLILNKYYNKINRYNRIMIKIYKITFYKNNILTANLFKNRFNWNKPWKFAN